MIRSVGVGGSSVNNQMPRRAQEAPQTPFPKIDGLERKPQPLPQVEEQPKKMMVGGKVMKHIRSIFEEVGNVVRKNADGDSLEVSKKAISMAKEMYK